MKTYSAKPQDIKNKWWVIDAQDVVLGRMASHVAKMLRGKHKAMYTPHMDCGDHVIIINAEKVKLTGKKRADKTFFWHTGFPGGIKERKAGATLRGEHPERVIEKAVERMIPKGPLGNQQLKKLRVYAGASHPHEAQSPQVLDFGAMNEKNKR